MPDTLADGGPFPLLTVVDHWSRSSPAGFRMSDETVSEILDHGFGAGSGSRSITVDHGTEFQSRDLKDWAYHRGGQLHFFRPGKAVGKNLIIKGRLRDECLNVHPFASLAEAQAVLDAWWCDYRQWRPQSQLGPLTQEVSIPLRHVIVQPKKWSEPVKGRLRTGPTSTCAVLGHSIGRSR